MSREELERIDDAGMAAWDAHDAAGFAGLFADEFAIIDWSSPEAITSRDGAIAYAQAWFTAFPDMAIKQTNRLVDGDQVAAEVAFTGTNTGPMMMAGKEIPPTGASVQGRGCYTAKIAGGKIVEFRSMPDIAGMMMQLGFMPDM